MFSRRKSAIICLAMKIDSRLEMNSQSVANSLNTLGIVNIRTATVLASLLHRIVLFDVNDLDLGSCFVHSFYLWNEFQMNDSLSMKLASIQEFEHINSNLLYALMGYTMNPTLSKAAVKCLETLVMKEIEHLCESIDDDIDRAFRFSLWFEKQDLISREDRPIELSEIKAKIRHFYRVIITIFSIQNLNDSSSLDPQNRPWSR